jgi:hypothetical protein
VGSWNRWSKPNAGGRPWNAASAVEGHVLAARGDVHAEDVQFVPPDCNDGVYQPGRVRRRQAAATEWEPRGDGNAVVSAGEVPRSFEDVPTFIFKQSAERRHAVGRPLWEYEDVYIEL